MKIVEDLGELGPAHIRALFLISLERLNKSVELVSKNIY
jgi:hypothetical protein